MPNKVDLAPVTALQHADDLRCNRSVERFKIPFELARRLLAGIGHDLGSGASNTFVFLIDMNELFGDICPCRA